MADNINEPVEIGENIYWVGSLDDGILKCHTYLIIDKDEAVLIDPGSPLNFDAVYRKVTSLIPVEKIKYIVIGHQDPDVAASIPLFEKKGFRGKVATHWRTTVLVPHYGIKSPYYIVDQNQYKLTLSSGRIIEFISTPYLHFPGAIMTYDPKSRILFSSDLFGSLSTEKTLWASDDYFESMKAFHEHYMPSNEILSPVMELLLKIEISMIAPQHGSIIKENITDAIQELRDLECGSFLHVIKKELAQIGGYSGICNRILKRYYSIYQKQEVLAIFEDSPIVIDPESMMIKDFNLQGRDLWDAFFELIYSKKGVTWITLVDPLVKRSMKEYDIDAPKIYKTIFKELEEKADEISSHNLRLQELNDRLKNSLKETEEKLHRCPITQLHNEEFFKTYLRNEIHSLSGSEESVSLLIIEIDKMLEKIFDYGQNRGEEILKSTAYLLEKNQEPLIELFKLEGPRFAVYLPDTPLSEAVKYADKIRIQVSQSNIFLHPTTVSIGVSNNKEFKNLILGQDELVESIIKIAYMRLQLAKNQGMNIVCHESDITDYSESIGKVLVIDPDELYTDIIQTSLSHLNIKVTVSRDGLEALEIINSEKPDIIISEIFLPKGDGFMIREKILQSSSQKETPFILISHKKDDESIQRATQLDIIHYLKKPFMLSELVGLVKNIIST